MQCPKYQHIINFDRGIFWTDLRNDSDATQKSKTFYFLQKLTNILKKVRDNMLVDPYITIHQTWSLLWLLEEGGASLVGGEQVNAYSQLLAEQDPLQFWGSQRICSLHGEKSMQWQNRELLWIEAAPVGELWRKETGGRADLLRRHTWYLSRTLRTPCV